MSYMIAPGATSVSIDMRAFNLDGTPATAFDHTTAGLVLSYRRSGAVVVPITPAALAALTTVHTPGGVEYIAAGSFRVDLPDAACAAGSSGVGIYATATGLVIREEYIQLTLDDAAGFADAVVDADVNGVTLGTRLTRIPNVAPGSPGGLPVLDANSRVAAEVQLIGTDVITAAATAADFIAEVQSAVLTAIAALNNLSSAQAQTAAAAALTAYGPPTRTEATADKAAIIAGVNISHMNGAALTGDGSEANKIRTVNA